MPARPSLTARLATFARSLVTGAGATLTDLGVIAFAVGVLHVSPAIANVPALLAGAVVQFLGNRYFAFRAGAGQLGRQAALFALTEVGALALNAGLYHAVVTTITLGTTGAVVARAVTTNLVFLLFSYPIWQRVFKAPTVEARLQQAE